jgi:hypothetical protein
MQFTNDYLESHEPKQNSTFLGCGQIPQSYRELLRKKKKKKKNLTKKIPIGKKIIPIGKKNSLADLRKKFE